MYRVEVAKKQRKIQTSEVEKEVLEFATKNNVRKDTIINVSEDQLHSLKEDVHYITFCDDIPKEVTEKQLKFIYFEFCQESPEIETIENNEESVPASNHYLLPSTEFHGLWESLIYEDQIKENLMDFVQSVMLFSQKKIDYNIINLNRLVLLHGEPGTGKTSLAKGLAQKLSIHMKNYMFTHLFEINSHSLFSKWFSESGKLVMKMFQQIQEVIEIESSLVIILIDEVESIAYTRSAISDNEPTDSLRVVNAVLTQLDKIKKYPNVLILTTSNLTSSIDLAFLDRADIVYYIGQPSQGSIYRIFLGAIKELVRATIIQTSFPVELMDLEEGQGVYSEKLQELSKLAVGISGRKLRKLPLIAHSLFLKKEQVSLNEFLSALGKAIQKQSDDKSTIKHHNKNKLEAGHVNGF